MLTGRYINYIYTECIYIYISSIYSMQESEVCVCDVDSVRLIGEKGRHEWCQFFDYNSINSLLIV